MKDYYVLLEVHKMTIFSAFQYIRNLKKWSLDLGPPVTAPADYRIGVPFSCIMSL